MTEPRDWLWLLLLAAMWGGSFLFMRVAVPALGPFPLIALRLGVATLAPDLRLVYPDGLGYLAPHALRHLCRSHARSENR